MKKVVFVCVCLFAFGLMAWAQCGTSYVVKDNAATAYFRGPAESGFTAIPSSFFYAFNNGSANSGSCTPAWALAGGHYYYNVGGDWGNACAIGCIGTPPTGLRTVVVAYQSISPGAGTHTAKFAVCSVVYDGLHFYLDTMTNGNGGAGAQIIPNNVPTPVYVSKSGSAGNYTINLSWTAPAGGGTNGARGFYDSDPGADVISNWQIYYQIGTGSTTEQLAGWTLGGTFAGTANTASLTGVNWNGVDSIWFAMRPVFGATSGTAPVFPILGAAGTLAPTASGLFVQDSVAANHGQVTVNWRTNVESAVAGFDVVYSRTKAGTFTLVPGTNTAPKGNNSAYSVTFPKPVRVEKLFFKVQAHMTDGSSQFSDIMKLGGDESAPRLGKVLPD
jgi:hypothetical protein